MKQLILSIFLLFCLSTTVFVGEANAVVMAASVVDTNAVVKKSELHHAIDKSMQDGSAISGRSKSIFRNILPFRNNTVDNDKLLSNVKVFPNPISEQINLSFRLSKQNAVIIKVMDALGNEVMTLLNQQLDPGPQNHSFETNNKLTNGFYFIRVSAGTETVVKRISVQ